MHQLFCVSTDFLQQGLKIRLLYCNAACADEIEWLIWGQGAIKTRKIPDFSRFNALKRASVLKIPSQLTKKTQLIRKRQWVRGIAKDVLYDNTHLMLLLLSTTTPTLIIQISVHARLLFFWKKSKVHGLIRVYTFIKFEEFAKGARLLENTARLLKTTLLFETLHVYWDLLAILVFLVFVGNSSTFYIESVASFF